MSPLIKRNQVKSIRVDDATVINRYNFGTDVYDIVEIVVNGVHGVVKNHRSVKTYCITHGAGKFKIGGKDYAVEAGDVISVGCGSWLTIEGNNLQAIIITNPPFNSDDEEWKPI